MVTGRRPDTDAVDESPYERDSDHEYRALEADAGDEARIEEQARELEDERVLESGDDRAGAAAPTDQETRDGLRELDAMLDNAQVRDPEALASDQARRHALVADEWQGPLDEMMEKTTELSADELDAEQSSE